MGAKRIHVSSSIDSLLLKSDNELANIFYWKLGCEIRQELQRRKDNGEILIGSEGCDGFCPVHGCPGHELPD